MNMITGGNEGRILELTDTIFNLRGDIDDLKDVIDRLKHTISTLEEDMRLHYEQNH